MAGRWTIRTGVVALAAFSAPALSAETVQTYDGYGSWLVACDNTLSCTAKGFGDDGGPRAEWTIRREAGPEGDLTARLASETGVEPDALRLDGAALGIDGAAWRDEAGADGERWLVTDDAEAVRALVAAVRDGAVLELGAEASVPLDGLTAAIRRMDDRQGRTGTVTALLDPGANSASGVPAAPALPEMPDRPVEAALLPEEAGRLGERVIAEARQTLADEGCQEDRIAVGAEVHPLTDVQALVLVPCLMGAYQGSSLGFLVARDGGEPRLLALETPYGGNESDPGTQTLLTEGGFDPATGRLFMAARGRGLADCGLSATWIWTGTRFEMTDLALQNRCGGVEPGDWPTLFRSQG